MLAASVIRTAALAAGFDLCGIARCGVLATEGACLDRWLAQGKHGPLAYMERHAALRADPDRLMEGTRTVVVCAVNYRNPLSGAYRPGERGKIASYACTNDYHATLRGMLRTLLTTLRRSEPSLRGRMAVDTAPILEKAWAVRAGLGRIGRHTLLVTPCFGSWVVLGELLLDAEVDRYDEPLPGALCTACRRCVDACPARALDGAYRIDARRCIACRTIEREGTGDEERGEQGSLDGWMFGCDACQSVCPHNRATPPAAHPAFGLHFDARAMAPEEWLTMDEGAFVERFGPTPLSRAGLERLRRNLMR